jgi:RNA polymerase sigma-B factor
MLPGAVRSCQARPRLKRLPERERKIIELRFFRNLSQTAVARRLGISQMHVSRLQHRALGRLRELARGEL